MNGFELGDQVVDVFARVRREGQVAGFDGRLVVVEFVGEDDLTGMPPERLKVIEVQHRGVD